MRLCLQCRAVYDDSAESCGVDGAPLVDAAALGSQQAARLLRRLRAPTGLLAALAAGLALGVGTGAAIFTVRGRGPNDPRARPVAAPATTPAAEGAAPLADVPAAAATLQPPEEGRAGYLVIGLSSRERAVAEAEAVRRGAEWHRPHVRLSDDWAGLAPGWYIVVYEVLDERAAAESAAAGLRARGINAYVKHSGAPAAGRPSAKAAR